MNFIKIVSLITLFLSTLYAQTITIAVDAIHGKERAIKQWNETITYLNQKLPNYHFQLYPFLPKEFPEIKQKIQQGDIDFVISPPAMYVDLEVTLGASKILTLVKPNNITQFGSVIISYASSGITKLSQIGKNSHIVAVAPLGFGGWLIGYSTLKEHHVNFKEENVHFLGTQEEVVRAILNHQGDIGIIRTGILEELQAKKELNLNELTILNRQYHKDFPFICSTKLYPEWAFAKTKNVDDKISRDVALALLTLPQDQTSTKHVSWTVPYEYQSVRELMQTFELGPYKGQSERFLKQWIEHHKELFYAIIFILVLIILFLIYGKYINMQLQKKDREKEILLEKIKKLAYYDTLTMIPNRLSIMQSFKQMLATAQRHHLHITVMFIDLDGFKMVNDTLGHDVGDRVLKDVAQIFQSTLRKNDLYGRLGGDEFIVITLGIQEKKDIEKLVQKLLDHINAISLPPHIQEKFGASIGVVHTIPYCETTVESLLNEADDLMYKVKRQGKNNYTIKTITC